MDADGFAAKITLCTRVESEHREQLSDASNGRLAAFQHEQEIAISHMNDGAATLEIREEHADKADARLSTMLNGLWDLQLAALTILEDVFEVSQTPPSVERRQSVLQTLGNE